MTRPASRTRRIAAFAFDDLFLTSILGVLGNIIPVVGSVAAVGAFTALQDSSMGPGRSPGRALVGQRLAMCDGRPVSHTTAITRSVLRWAMWLTGVLLAVDLVLFATSGRLLADRLCGTRVWDERALDDAQYLLGAEDALDEELRLIGAHG